MQKFFVKAIVLTCLVLVAVIFFTAISINRPKADTKKIFEATSTTISPLYTLSEYEGKIALYKRGFSMPVEIYSVLVSSLPIEEQERIKNGISAETDEEILRIIEDYTS